MRNDGGFTESPSVSVGPPVSTHLCYDQPFSLSCHDNHVVIFLLLLYCRSRNFEGKATIDEYEEADLSYVLML